MLNQSHDKRLVECKKQVGVKTDFEVGEQNGITVHGGVYVQVPGPQFDTPAEIRTCRSLGADTIVTSMADEVIAARRRTSERWHTACSTCLKK